MFKQLLTPVAGSLPLSFIVAALPVATVLVLLGVMRRPAWQASLAGLVVGLIIAIGIWSLPADLAFQFYRQRRRVRPVAGHVDRRQRASSLQYRGRVRNGSTPSGRGFSTISPTIAASCSW